MATLMHNATLCDGTVVPIYVNMAHNSSKSIRVLEMAFEQEDTKANKDEGDRLTYSAASTELPEGWRFDTSRRKFTWTPGWNTSGEYAITFTVKDNGSPELSDSETITITVVSIWDDD